MDTIFQIYRVNSIIKLHSKNKINAWHLEKISEQTTRIGTVVNAMKCAVQRCNAGQGRRSLPRGRSPTRTLSSSAT